jgi:hypothetical protein
VECQLEFNDGYWAFLSKIVVFSNFVRLIPHFTFYSDHLLIAVLKNSPQIPSPLSLLGHRKITRHHGEEVATWTTYRNLGTSSLILISFTKTMGYTVTRLR